MPNVAELGKLVKQKYPGAYDHVDDHELGVAVQQKFPGAYSEFQDPERTLGGQAKEFAKGMAGAIPEGGIQMLRGLGALPDYLTGGLATGHGMLAALASKAYQPVHDAYEGSAYQQATAAAPGYEDSIGRMGGQVIGSAIPLLAASAIGGPIPATVMAVTQGAGSQAQNIDQLRAQGAQISQTQQDLATALGGVIGATEMIPLARLSNPLGRVVQRGLGRAVAAQTGRTAEEAANRGISRFVSSIVTQAAEEAAQEGGSQGFNNAIEKYVYNDKRGLTDNVLQSAIAGAFGGAALDASIGHLARKIEARQLAREQEPTRWRDQVEAPAVTHTQRVVDEPSTLPYPTPQQVQPQIRTESEQSAALRERLAQPVPDGEAASQPQSTKRSKDVEAQAAEVLQALETPTPQAPLQTNVQSEAPVDPSAISPIVADPLSSEVMKAEAEAGIQSAPSLRGASSQVDTGDPLNAGLPPEASAPAAQEAPSRSADRPTPSQPQSTEQWKAQATPIARTLRSFADKVGAKDTYLRVIDRIADRVTGAPVDEVLGKHDRGLIEVAYKGAEAPHELIGTTGHEVTHAFKEMGLYTEPEWKVLEKQARKDGTLDLIKGDEYYSQLTPEKQVEEAIARQFERFVANEYNPQGQQRGLFSRAKNFLDRLHSGFRGQGFLTAEDVLTRFDAGDIGRRNRPNGVELNTGVTINGNVASVDAEPSRPEQGQAVQTSEDVAEDLPEGLISPEAYEPTEGGQENISGETAKPSLQPVASSPQRSGSLVQDSQFSRQLPESRASNSPVQPTPTQRRLSESQSIEGQSQPQSTPVAHQKLLSVTDYSSGQGRRKTIAEMRQESGLPPEEFDNAFRELVKQDRILSSKGGMSVENMLRDGFIEEGNYVAAPDGKPYITASLNEPTEMYSRGLHPNTDPVARQLAEQSPIFGTPAKQKGLGRSILDIVTKADERKRAITAFRQAAFDQRARIAESDRLRAKNQGDLFADKAAAAAAYLSDRSSNVAAGALTNGGLIYDKGFFKASNVDKNGKPVKGLLKILEPLMKNGTLDNFFHYQAALRGEALMPDGKEKLLTPQQIAAFKGFAQQFPEIKTASDEFKAWNDTFVDALADSGRISKATAADWKSRPYLPFYRIADDLVSGPSTRGTIGGAKTLHKIEGNDALIADPLQNIVRNMMSLTDIAMKNVASQRAVRNAIELGWARPAQTGDKNAVTVYKDGKAARFAIDDPLMFEAMTATDLPLPKLFEMGRIPAQWLRNFVTKSPMFMLKNLARDTMDIFLKGGFNLMPFTSTVNGAMQAFSESPHYKALENAGVVGGALMEGGTQGTADRVERKLRQNAGQHSRLSEFWDKLGEWSEKSEAANRIKVYENALKQHGNEAQAVFEALEVMNFSRRGNSQLMRMATATIPFLNARLQGLDLFGRHAAGHAYGFDAAKGGRGAEVRKQMLQRGLFVLAGTMLYAMAISTNKAWQQATPQERDDNWFLPIGDDDGPVVKVPIPFELGFIWKTVPERMWALATGHDRADQTVGALKRGAENNLLQPMIPQAIKPMVENYFNYSTFKGGPIENAAQKQLLPEERWDEYTSQAARRIGKASGQSPLQIDNLLRGYFGTMGQFGLGLMDSLMRPESQGPKADYALWNAPMVGSLFQRPDGAGKIIDFYEFHTQVDQAARTLKQIQQYGDPEKLQKFVKDHQKELALQPAVDRLAQGMSAITKMERQIQNSPAMTGEQKRKLLDELRKRKSEIAAQGVSLKGMKQ